MSLPEIVPAADVADSWATWCGENRWTKAMRSFGSLGGKCQWWCGYPQSASAVPLTFALFAPDGRKLLCNYRLKDIVAAIAELET